MPEMVMLVDEHDNPVGEEEKLKAHQNGGKLHRAISIYIFNSKGQLLLQNRSVKKYHFGGLWTNTTCSHPRPGESSEDASHRRLQEEMGFDCPLKETLTITYKVTDKDGLTEWEFAHVFLGKYDGEVHPNPEEADGFKWISIEDLTADVKAHPEKYTSWFLIAIPRVLEKI